MLVKNNHYTDGISRAYYSSLQFIFHVLIEKLGKTHDEINNAPRTGTHAQAQYLLELELANKDFRDYKWFQEKFSEFKESRVKADYHDFTFGQSDGHGALKLANSIMSTLKQHFK